MKWVSIQNVHNKELKDLAIFKAGFDADSESDSDESDHTDCAESHFEGSADVNNTPSREVLPPQSEPVPFHMIPLELSVDQACEAIQKVERKVDLTTEEIRKKEAERRLSAALDQMMIWNQNLARSLDAKDKLDVTDNQMGQVEDIFSSIGDYLSHTDIYREEKQSFE